MKDAWNITIDGATAERLSSSESNLTTWVHEQFEKAFLGPAGTAARRTPEGLQVAIEVRRLETEHNLWAVQLSAALRSVGVEAHVYVSATDDAYRAEKRGRVRSALRRSRFNVG